MQRKLFENSILVVTGGTGSFGNAVVKRLVREGIREIRILSRDEKKQDDMRRAYGDPRIKFYLGDVRDMQSVQAALSGADYVFHAAALKQVPSCEFYPLDAVKTNVLGTDNVLSASIAANVKKVICLSTDKAVYPINAMGASKALMEKVMIAKSRITADPNGNTVICGTRYGNVMASRGSVIPLFVSQLQSNSPVTITDESMTRFMMTLEDAVELVLYAFENGSNGDIFVQKAPAATIKDLATAVADWVGAQDWEVHHLGPRHGEKLYEVLCSREEMAVAVDEGGFYRIPTDSRDLNYGKYFDEGDSKLSHPTEYTSHNTERLSAEGMRSLLSRLSLDSMIS